MTPTILASNDGHSELSRNQGRELPQIRPLRAAYAIADCACHHECVDRHTLAMEEIINVVVQKTGISQEDAQKAVEVIINELKSRLPGPIASHLDSFIAGGMSGGMSTLAGEAGDVLKSKLGGLFGGTQT
jgi:hypothetical protein